MGMPKPTWQTKLEILGQLKGCWIVVFIFRKKRGKFVVIFYFAEWLAGYRFESLQYHVGILTQILIQNYILSTVPLKLDPPFCEWYEGETRLIGVKVASSL